MGRIFKKAGILNFKNLKKISIPILLSSFLFNIYNTGNLNAMSLKSALDSTSHTYPQLIEKLEKRDQKAGKENLEKKLKKQIPHWQIAARQIAIQNYPFPVPNSTRATMLSHFENSEALYKNEGISFFIVHPDKRFDSFSISSKIGDLSAKIGKYVDITYLQHVGNPHCIRLMGGNVKMLNDKKIKYSYNWGGIVCKTAIVTGLYYSLCHQATANSLILKFVKFLSQRRMLEGEENKDGKYSLELHYPEKYIYDIERSAEIYIRNVYRIKPVKNVDFEEYRFFLKVVSEKHDLGYTVYRDGEKIIEELSSTGKSLISHYEWSSGKIKEMKRHIKYRYKEEMKKFIRNPQYFSNIMYSS